MRGMLTSKVQDLAREFLGREITVRELRLYPYLDFTMKNDQELDPRRINQEEKEILKVLRDEGHLIVQAGLEMGMTKEFYDYINQVLWYSYVVKEG